MDDITITAGDKTLTAVPYQSILGVGWWVTVEGVAEFDGWDRKGCDEYQLVGAVARFVQLIAHA